MGGILIVASGAAGLALKQHLHSASNNYNSNNIK